MSKRRRRAPSSLAGVRISEYIRSQRTCGGAARPRHKGYVVRTEADVPPTPCPCGASRRIVTKLDTDKVSFHVVDIRQDSRKHYHKKLTEIYYVLEGEGHLEADDDVVPLRPGTAVVIKPGTRHRAVGRLRIVNVVVPVFDEKDEHF